MTHKDAKRNTVNDAEQFPQSSKPTLRKNGENENFDKFQPVFIESFEDRPKTLKNLQIFLQTI